MCLNAFLLQREVSHTKTQSRESQGSIHQHQHHVPYPPLQHGMSSKNQLQELGHKLKRIHDSSSLEYIAFITWFEERKQHPTYAAQLVWLKSWFAKKYTHFRGEIVQSPAKCPSPVAGVHWPPEVGNLQLALEIFKGLERAIWLNPSTMPMHRNAEQQNPYTT